MSVLFAHIRLFLGKNIFGSFWPSSVVYTTLSALSKAGDTLDASVFLGGDNAVGIMTIKDENGEEYFLRISEFHLLSLRENSDSRKEVGLMTSLLWLTAKAYTSIIFASNLLPVKNLLLSDWLQKEWQRAKDSASKLPNEEVGGESNG